MSSRNMLLLGASLVTSLCLWALLADADLSTLWAHVFFYRRRNKYRGQVIWITGASSGIGEELAYIFARLGCRLVISGTRKGELERVRNRCELISSECEVFIQQGDIADIKQHMNWMRLVLDKFGRIDVLVNNAGRSQRSEFVKIPEETDKELFDVNVFGMVSLTRLILKHWIAVNQSNKEILVTSSAAGKLGAPFSATYTASKHALHGYFEALRSEMCILGYSLQITLACPGPVRSNIRVTAYTEKVGERYNQPDQPWQKLMETSRCAHLMVSGLASGLDELWIARQPILFTYYLAQYIPSIYRRFLLPFVMNKSTMKAREGK